MVPDMDNVSHGAEADGISLSVIGFPTGTARARLHEVPARQSSISSFNTPESARSRATRTPRQPREARNLTCHSNVMPNTITSRNILIGSRDTRPVRIAIGGSAHHAAGQTSETFSQAISRCSVTPSTTRDGGIRIISPFSNRTPRGCFVPIRLGSGAASTVVTSCLPSYM